MVRDLALVLARETLQPNLIYNHQRSEQAKQQRLSGLQPIDRHVERGRSIVRKGDLITHQQAVMLATLSHSGGRDGGIFGAFVSVMVLSAIVIVGCTFLQLDISVSFPREHEI